MKYRRDIDGLRAVAVVPVVLFHARTPMFGGGFVGVDVFFVISGYLITLLIVSEIEGGTFSFADFYERRIRQNFSRPVRGDGLFGRLRLVRHGAR